MQNQHDKLARWRIYVLAVPVIAILSIVVVSALGQLLSTSLYHLVRDVAKTHAYAIVFNTLPPFLVGFVCILGIAVWRGPIAKETHFVRAWPLYAASVGLGAYAYVNRGTPDFGFVSQLFSWPCCAFLGGIVGDAVAVRFPAHRTINRQVVHVSNVSRTRVRHSSSEIAATTRGLAHGRYLQVQCPILALRMLLCVNYLQR